MNPRDFAERALLGTLLHEPGRVRDLDWLSSDDFYRPAHQDVFAGVRDLVASHDTAAGGPPAEDAGSAVDGVDPVAVWQRVQDRAEHASAQHTTLTAPGLHSLMETAPPAHAAQPAVYATIVLESSMRRQISQDGMRVGQTSSSPELATMLGEVSQALQHVEEVEQRWHGSNREPQTPTQGASEAVLREPPSSQQRTEAEHSLVEHVLARPELLDELPELAPDDISDPAVANTLRAAAELHADPAGPRADAVTVAWQQQRSGLDGLSPEQLSAASGHTPVGDPQHDADVVLRGSLASHIQQASEAVQRTAQEPTLQPEAVLATARAAYQDVQQTAQRVSTSQQPSAAAQLASRGAGPSLSAALREQHPEHGTAATRTEPDITAHREHREPHSPER